MKQLAARTGMRFWPALAIAVPLLSSPQAQSETAANPALRSGYLLTAETCGGFPKLRITMQPGYCAGLVAAKDDGLIFPRTLVQVPDMRFFVVADMGGWEPKKGHRPGREFCLLREVADPACR